MVYEDYSIIVVKENMIDMFEQYSNLDDLVLEARSNLEMNLEDHALVI